MVPSSHMGLFENWVPRNPTVYHPLPMKTETWDGYPLIFDVIHVTNPDDPNPTSTRSLHGILDQDIGVGEFRRNTLPTTRGSYGVMYPVRHGLLPLHPSLCLAASAERPWGDMLNGCHENVESFEQLKSSL